MNWVWRLNSLALQSDCAAASPKHSCDLYWNTALSQKHSVRLLLPVILYTLSLWPDVSIKIFPWVQHNIRNICTVSSSEEQNIDFCSNSFHQWTFFDPSFWKILTSSGFTLQLLRETIIMKPLQWEAKIDWNLCIKIIVIYLFNHYFTRKSLLWGRPGQQAQQ